MRHAAHCADGEEEFAAMTEQEIKTAELMETLKNIPGGGGLSAFSREDMEESMGKGKKQGSKKDKRKKKDKKKPEKGWMQKATDAAGSVVDGIKSLFSSGDEL